VGFLLWFQFCHLTGLWVEYNSGDYVGLMPFPERTPRVGIVAGCTDGMVSGGIPTWAFGQDEQDEQDGLIPLTEFLEPL
jgi:hypothetical protein